MVEHVLRDVKWMFVRGVFDAVLSGGTYADPSEVDAGNAVGVVHVTRTVLRGASLVDVGNSAVALYKADHMSGRTIDAI